MNTQSLKLFWSLLAFLMVSFSPCLAASHKHISVEKEEDHFKVETRSWVLRSWATKGQTRRYARGIEAVQENLNRILGLNSKIGKKAGIKILRSKSAFLSYVKKDLGEVQFIGGYFSSEKNEIVTWNQSTDQTLSILGHELTHWLIRQVIGHPQIWLDEGFAEYIGFSKIRWGKLKEAARDENALRMIFNASQSKVLIPLSRLISLNAYLEGHLRKLQYAQSWGLVYFLLHGHGGVYQERFLNYVRALKKDSHTPLERFISLDEVEPVWVKELKMMEMKNGRRSLVPEFQSDEE